MPVSSPLHPLRLALILLGTAGTTVVHAGQGYYRDPALHGDSVVFTAEGDLWRASTAGGVAHRLTRHPGVESQAAISPDGRWIAFTASYDGPEEVYVMPMAGGQPTRVSFDNGRVWVQPWSPDGKVVYATDAGHGLFNVRSLRKADPVTGDYEDIPLADASEGAIDDDGRVVFTRMGLHLSTDNAVHYRGGAAAQLWTYNPGDTEAQRLAQPVRASDSDPQWQDGQIVFVSNAGGRANLWRMQADGSARSQLTRHEEFSVSAPSAQHGRVVYQLGGDLRLLDLASGEDRALEIALASDFDPKRLRWIDKPLTYFESASLDKAGQRVAVTVRGGASVFGSESIRRAALPMQPGVRVREAVMSHDGKQVYAIAGEGEQEHIVRFAADGSGGMQRVIERGAIRWGRLYPSPAGKHLLVSDFEGQLQLIDLERRSMRVLDASGHDGAEPFASVQWSGDGSLVAVARADSRQRRAQIVLIDVASGRKEVLTSDKYNSFAPAFSADGQWLYFISRRQLTATPSAPWGDRNMGPAFLRQGRIYALALRADAVFPFAPRTELSPASAKPEPDTAKDKDKPAVSHAARVQWEGLATRLFEVPLPADEFEALELDDKRLYFSVRPPTAQARAELRTLALESQAKPEVFAKEVAGFEVSADGKRVLVVQANDAGVTGLLLLDAAAKAPDDVAKATLATADWRIAVSPEDEWQQQFHDAWRMHRAYSFDPGMRGVDWPAMRTRYARWLPRLTDRHELNDLLGKMIAELDILHSQVRSTDLPSDAESPKPASLGARWQADAQGLLIAHVYNGERELPDTLPPLLKPGVDARVGDRLLAVNGRAVRSLAELNLALDQQAGQQVLLRLQRGNAAPHQTIAVAESADKDAGWRYADWVLGRRARVEQVGDGRVGYLHLRAMGGGDIATFAREFYAQVDREGLVIDVRRNRGGNIDSWIIEKLLRRAWAFWSDRKGEPYWNMQNAFRGHLVVLTDEFTYSDGETFAAGVKSLGLGKLVGKQTAGAGIWLSDRNRLSDGGIARIAEFPQFSLDGRWLLEGRGVSPDIEVDNLPHATFNGADAQLEAALELLRGRIEAEPVPLLVPAPIAPSGTSGADVTPLPGR